MNRTFLARVFAKSLLLSTFFVPLIVSQFAVFPFVYGKALFLYALVEAALISFLLYVFLNYKEAASELSEWRGRVNQKLLVVFGVFLICNVLSTIFSPVPATAFWGSPETNNGLFMQFHLFVFAVLTSILFTRSDWKLYLKGLLACTVLISLVAWLEYIGVEATFPIIITKKTEPDSFLGNPAYLASYVVSFLYVWQLVKEPLHGKRKYWYFGTLFFLVGTVIITSIRGALLGLLAGVVFVLVMRGIQSSSKKIKIGAIIVLVSMLCMVTLFVATKSSPVWEATTVTSRLAHLSFTSQSIVERLTAWKAGALALADRPVIGFGTEYFGPLYEKYGFTAVSCYHDAWYTSLHNKAVDVLASTGVLGFVALLALILFLVFENRKNLFFLVFFVAYLVQDLFIYDTVLTLLVFTVAVAITLSTRPTHTFLSGFRMGKRVAQTGVALLLVVTIAGFNTGVLQPFRQERLFGRFLKVPNGNALIPLIDPLLYPETPVQVVQRMIVAKTLRQWGMASVPQGRELMKKAIAALEETVAHNPDNMRLYDELIRDYLALAPDEPMYYDKAEQVAQKAVSLAPNFIRMQHILSATLIAEKKYDEADVVLKKAFSLDPHAVRTKLYDAVLAFERNSSVGRDKLIAVYDQSLTPTCADNPLSVQIQDKQFSLFNDFDFEVFTAYLVKAGEHDYAEKVRGYAAELYPSVPAFTQSTKSAEVK